MKKEENDIFENNDSSDQDDIFAGASKSAPSTEDIFAGDNDFIQMLDNSSGKFKRMSKSILHLAGKDPETGPVDVEKTAKSPRKHAFSGIYVVQIALIGVLAMFGYMLLRPGSPETEQKAGGNENVTQNPIGPAPVVPAVTNNQIQSTEPVTTSVIETPPVKATVEEDVAEPVIAYDIPLSWELGQTLFAEKDYEKSYYVFEKLSEYLSLDDADSDLYRDILQLQMAMCKYHNDEKGNFSQLFSNPLDSRSPSIRALANYYLSFIDMRNKRYLMARTRAYRALSLIDAISEYFPADIEADIYFLATNAITNEVMRIKNVDTNMPGRLWADTLIPHKLPAMDKAALNDFVHCRLDKLQEAFLEPKVNQRRQLASTPQYSVVSYEAPLSELIARFAAEANYDIVWTKSTAELSAKSTTIYIPNAPGQVIPEYIAGCSGMIARIDDGKVTMYNPLNYSSLDEHSELLAQEAITDWRHFLWRYLGQKRAANAHFALGVLQGLLTNMDVAIGEYKLLVSQYSNSSLAPYALLNSSKLRTEMKDYTGARQDLGDLVMQFSESMIVDQAYLYMAQATMESGLYDEAARVFSKAYHLNLTESAKASAAYGAAMSHYNLNDFKQAESWFAIVFKNGNDAKDIELPEVYYYYARTKFSLGKNEEAIACFKNALSGIITNEEYTKILIEIAETYMENGESFDALETLENVPPVNVSQLQLCQVIITKARILRSVDLADSAISILRHKIEYLANPALRAELMVELARCYDHDGQYEYALDEMASALVDLPSSQLAIEANIEMAKISLKLELYGQGVETCLRLLNSPLPEKSRNDTFNVLGTAYNKLKMYDKAALAFAGIYDNGEVSKL